MRFNLNFKSHAVGKPPEIIINYKEGVTMKKLLRTLAAVILGLGLSTGLAAAQHSEIENGNGTDSSNTITFDNEHTVDVDNNNDVSFFASNNQVADSGDASADANTDVSGVHTGDAENDATVDVDVDADNSSAMSWDANDLFGGTEGSIDNGNGTNSENTITHSNNVNYSVTNDNNVVLTITNEQDADSGDASADANTDVGNVSTGNASNSFSSSTSIRVSN